MQILKQGSRNSTNIARHFKAGPISGAFKLVEKHFDKEKYFDLRNRNQDFLGWPQPPHTPAGARTANEQTLQGGRRLSYGLSSPPSKLMRNFYFFKSNKIMFLVFHGFLVINRLMLFFIGIIDCICSYGIVLFYPFYQWVRSGLLS